MLIVLGSWKRCASLPSPLYSAACCSHKEIIYVFSHQVIRTLHHLIFKLSKFFFLFRDNFRYLPMINNWTSGIHWQTSGYLRMQHFPRPCPSKMAGYI